MKKTKHFGFIVVCTRIETWDEAARQAAAQIVSLEHAIRHFIKMKKAGKPFLGPIHETISPKIGRKKR